jgi:DNA-directed RNA polymerase subunit A'
MEEVHRFFWYVKPDEIYTDEVEILRPDEPPRMGTGTFVDFDLTNGRLKSKWVPMEQYEAVRYLLHHEDAAGLRAASDTYFIIEVTYAEPIKNMIETRKSLVPTGYNGAVIKVPIKETIRLGRLYEEDTVKFWCDWRRWMVNIKEPMVIDGVNMEIMTAEEIRQLSEMEVTVSDVLKETETNPSAVINGPMDPRMGSLAKDEECPTCRMALSTIDSNSCNGHFGHIDLPIPIPNLLFLGERSREGKSTYPIMEALNKTCIYCHRVVLPQEIIDGTMSSVLQEFENGGKNHASRARIRNILKPYFEAFKKSGRICPHCEEVTPEITFSYRKCIFKLGMKDKAGRSEYDYGAAHVLLKEISDEDCYFLAINPITSHPKHMFFEYLPVMPNTSRPLKVRSDGKTEIDDLTHLYSQVVYQSERIYEIRRGQQKTDREQYYTRELFLSVCRIINNHNQTIGSGGSNVKYSYQGGESLASYDGILNRLAGKGGRMRKDLQSKSVESVTYSVISPDPMLAIDEVGVPLSIVTGKDAINYPHIVTKENIKEMKGYMQNTIDNIHPMAVGLTDAGIDDGRSHLTKNPGRLTDEETGLYRPNNKEWMDQKIESLRPGMVLSVQIKDGDIGLFNRAPSLHRQSVLALRVRIVPTKTLRMNPTVCIPFNADYDGDAMKLHFVQSEPAKKEAEKLMLLTKNIIHARYGKLTVATDQDQTSGLYLLSYTDMSKANTWSENTELGYNENGNPFVSKSLALSCYSEVFSEIRGKEKQYRTIESLPEPDSVTGNGEPGYSGRSLFSHLFTVLDCEYVSASFSGRTPKTVILEDGSIIVKRENGKKIKENVVIKDGKLIAGTLEKAAFGEGGASIAPSFIYHEGYEGGQAKLVEFIEMVTRLGFAAHRVIGYTMGTSDVSAPQAQPIIDQLYTECIAKITKIDRAFADGTLKQYVETHTPEKKVTALSDPLNYIEDEVLKFTSDFENALLKPIENYQGSGNPMQIAVRSGARGKDLNIQQMAGAYGMVRLGSKRITSGINPDRVLPHYPKKSLRPEHRGFIRSNYSKGMEPDEYWLTSTAGRRSSAESSQGNIQKSGALERKMIKALESCVVNQRRQVVNLRTGRIISPLVGDDGLAPYHIRGDDDKINSKGYSITLQPYFYDFECKHGLDLIDFCHDCQKGSDITTFTENVDKIVSQTTQDKVTKKLSVRELTKPNVKKMALRLNAYYEDSLCRYGEAIGATAGACIGEPATQAALRTFHFAGKMSVQGSVDRLRQILEYTKEAKKLGKETNYAPETLLTMAEGATKEDAELVMALLTEVKGGQIIKLVAYDTENNKIAIKFDFSAMGTYRISPNVVIKQVKTALDKGSSAGLFTFTIISEYIQPGVPFEIGIEAVGSSPSVFLYAKELIMNTNYNGIGNVTNIELVEPDKDERYKIKILSSSEGMLDTIVDVFPSMVDLSLLETNNHQWIEKNFGLEAALANLYKELDYQMNITEQGIGEYDMRYIRTIVDCMGEYGYVKSLAPWGLSGWDNPSILGGMSMSYLPDIITGGATMGNEDPIDGVTESIVVGAIPKIGDYAPE